MQFTDSDEVRRPLVRSVLRALEIESRKKTPSNIHAVKFKHPSQKERGNIAVGFIESRNIQSAPTFNG